MDTNSELYKAFKRFRVVQDEDSDPEPETVVAEAEPVAPEPEPIVPEPEAVAPEPEPEPVAVAPEPEPVAVTPEPAPVTATAAQDPPAAAAAEEELFTCSLCSNDDIPADQMTATKCCSRPVCKECYKSGGFISLDSAICYFCNAELDTVIYSDILDKDKTMTLRKVLARKHEGGWINCSYQGCKGGAPGAAAPNKEVTCETCGQNFCSNCADAGLKGYGHRHTGMTCDAYREQLSAGPSAKKAVEISIEDNIGWSGAITCPHCGRPAQRDGGCDVLTCEGEKGCGKQFRADGEKSLEHSSIAGAFDNALETFSNRSTVRQVEELIAEHSKMARLFRLDHLLARVRLASDAKDGDAVGQLCAPLANNPILHGLQQCLLSRFMPPTEAEIVFQQAIASAETLAAVHDILSHDDSAGLYPGIAADADIIQGIIDDSPMVEFALMGRINKIKNEQLKSRVKALTSESKGP